MGVPLPSEEQKLREQSSHTEGQEPGSKAPISPELNREQSSHAEDHKSRGGELPVIAGSTAPTRSREQRSLKTQIYLALNESMPSLRISTVKDTVSRSWTRGSVPATPGRRPKSSIDAAETSTQSFSGGENALGWTLGNRGRSSDDQQPWRIK